MNNSLPPILIAEDEETDRLIYTLAFERAGIPNPLALMPDGQAAVDYLAANPRPAMMLLDLKMPRMDGFDVLAWLQGHTEFSGFPVFVFSSSSCQNDMARARELGATDYYSKPPHLGELVNILKSLQERVLH